MKKLLLATVLIIGLSFVGCDKDDDPVYKEHCGTVYDLWYGNDGNYYVQFYDGNYFRITQSTWASLDEEYYACITYN